MNALVFCWILALALAALTFTAGTRVRRSRDSRHRDAVRPARRAPADAARPILHDAADLDDPEDARLSACPICGMADPGNLDASHLGWPAHGECVEWLGDWKPPAGTKQVPRRAIAAANAHVAALKTINETHTELVLDGLNQQIAACFAIPPATVRAGHTNTTHYNGSACTTHIGGGGGGGTSESMSTATRWCVCGMAFTGTHSALQVTLAAHHNDGTCRYSPAGRQSPGSS